MNDMKLLIRDIRLEQGLTQKDLADKADIGIRYLRDLEYNKKIPSIITIYKLAVALNVPITALFSVSKDFLKP